jgi:hypothetical protein
MQTSVGANEFVIAKRLFEAAQQGELSEFDLNIAMREFARVYHDGSMAKFLDTELGKIFLQPRTMRKSVAEEYDLLAKRVDRGGSGLQYSPNQNGDGMDEIDWGDDVQASKAHRKEVEEKRLRGERGDGRRDNPDPISP